MTILDVEAIARSTLVQDPFDFFVAHRVIRPEWTEALLRDLPRVTRPGSVPVAGLKGGPTFEALVRELGAREFARAVGARLGISDLALFPQLLTFRGRAAAKDGSVHTDAAWKLVTALLYLNPAWDHPGGRLRLLRSADLDDVAVEVPPEFGTLVVFRRSERSFHGHRPYVGPRFVLQVNWVSDAAHVAREERRHRLSTALKAWFRRPAVE